MKGNQPRILPSVFKDRYQVIVGTGQALQSSTEKHISCPVYAEQFLRRTLSCSPEYWRSIVSQYFSGHSTRNDRDLYAFIAQQCVNKRIRFYQLPSLTHSSAFTHNGLGRGYRFANAGPADMFHNAEPVALKNEADVEKLLSSLRVKTDSFWTQALKENDALPTDPRVDHRSHLKQLISSGQLAVFSTAYTPKPPAPEGGSSSSSSSQPATQADKKAPLAPESDTDSSPAEQDSDTNQSESSSQEEAQAKQGETDEVSQTQTMQDAAEAGAAFCEECEK